MQLWLICFMTVFLAKAYGDSEPEPQDTFPFDDERSADDDLDLMLRGHKGGKGKSCNCKAELDVLESKLDQILGLIQSGEPASTCKDIFENGQSSGNKAYQLEVGSAYCHMTELVGCGGGGWTLVMKTDGTKDTFKYDSSLWSNKDTFNPAGGETGFDSQQTKLPTYWNTPFTKICLGMKIGQQPPRFIVINKQANSLHSLIADGQYRATSLGRNTWKKLIGSDASLQRNCNKEGFNVVGNNNNKFFPQVRIGILGNQENNCLSCDSRIGFGARGHPDDSNTCGNVASHNPDNGDKRIKAMGYILVQ